MQSPVKDKETGWTASVNEHIATFLSSHTEYVSLGPDYSSMTFKEAERNLILHRLHKNFERPDDTHSSERRSSSLKAMLEYDSRGITSFEPALMDLDPYVRHQLYRARLQLNEIITDYRFSISALEFPGGETFVSADGDISLYAKLRDREQWCVTPQCFDHFARICYHSPILKYAARRHMSTREWRNNAIWAKATLLFVKKNGEVNHEKAAFHIFKEKLRQIVTFVEGARLSTVPKSTLVDRVITCEPLCNMIVQRTVEQGVRDVIKNHFDIDLDTSQVLHKALITDPECATIDFKNASNSVFTAVIIWFLEGTTLLTDLMHARSAQVSSEGEWNELNMLSPMGNGYTFGVMTLLLLVITRQFDDFSHVFGDDVVVHNSVAADVIATLSVIGFQTNDTKTFTNGNFRESCGGFTSCGKYITSFDLYWSEDEVDAVVTINKIGILAYATNSSLRVPLQQLHANLLELVPVSLLRPVYYRKNFATRKVHFELEALQRSALRSNGLMWYYHSDPQGLSSIKCRTSLGGDEVILNGDRFSLSDGVYTRTGVFQSKISDTSKRETQRFLRDKVNKDLQLGGEEYASFILLTKKADCYRFKPGKGQKRGRPRIFLDNASRLHGWYYQWAGKTLAPNLRDTYVSRKWVTQAPKTLG